MLAPVTEADGRLGLCDVLPGNTPGGQPWGQLAFDAGARVNRWEFRWDRIEPQPGAWDFAAPDAAVQSDQKYGLDTLGILIGTPGWAARRGQKPGNGLPRGLYLAYTDPRNLWADYVRQTVSHYKGQVAWWEIWNEPDLQFFWTGSPDDYFRLLKVAYLTIQAADPAARVLMAGMVVPDMAFLTRVLQDVERDPRGNDNHGYFDALAWHAYGPASTVYANVSRIRGLLAALDYVGIPVWVTEDGFPSSNPNGEPRQAAYVLQTIAYALAAGASRVLVYRSSDDPTPKTWGLISAAGAPRMGYVAFQVAARYFAHTQYVTYLPASTVERFAFSEPGQRVTLIWNHGPTDLSLDVSADQPTAELVDWMGTTSTLTASNGQFHLVVPGAQYNAGIDPAGLVVGGPPVLLVQDNTPPTTVTSQSYITPVPGGQRSLVLFNGSATPVTVQIAAAAHPEARAVVRLLGYAVHPFDLDLLAGAGYDGMYVLSSSGPVTAEAISDRAEVQSETPAENWYLPSAPAVVTVGNASNRPVEARILGYGPKGAIRAQGTLLLKPGSESDWQLPPVQQGRQLAATVQATGPVVVAGAGAVSAPQATWYAVRPPTSRLSIFNPDPSTLAQVDIRFVGSPSVTGEQLEVAPRHSYTVPIHGAKAVVLQASHAVTVGYAGTDSTLPGVSASASTQTVLPAAGHVTGVALFNPSQQAAHVTLSVVGASSTKQVTRVLPPSGFTTVRARSASGAPRGVSLSSDVPVVAAPVTPAR